MVSLSRPFRLASSRTNWRTSAGFRGLRVCLLDDLCPTFEFCRRLVSSFLRMGFNFFQTVSVANDLEVEAPSAGDTGLPEVSPFIVFLGTQGKGGAGSGATAATAYQTLAGSS